MNSAKSANLLMVAHNYRSQNKEVLLMKPGSDTRWAAITSRAIAEKEDAAIFDDNHDLYKFTADLITDLESSGKVVHAVLIDEAQFITEIQAEQLAKFVDDYKIPVLCYGLKNRAAKGKLFKGSYGLLCWADSIEEIKTVCQYCNRKATQNLMLLDGVPEYEPDEIVMADIVGDLRIIPACRYHYLNPILD